MHIHRLFPLLLALALGPALADGAAPSSFGNLSSVKNALPAGATLTLLDANDQLVATLGKDGALTLAAGANLSAATKVTVTGVDGAQTYTLARSVETGQVFVNAAGPQGQAQVLPLVAVLHRYAGQAGPRDDAQVKPKPEAANKPEATEKPERAKKPEATEKPETQSKPDKVDDQGAGHGQAGGEHGKGKGGK